MLITSRQGAPMPNYISHDQVPELLKNAQRILVVGCSGGGKTTLSTKISKLLNLEYISLDRDIRWLPNWVERDKQAQRNIIAELVKKPHWVIDGSGVSSFELRVPPCDLILWVRVSRFTALKGLTFRVLSNFGSVRAQMAEGCPEKLPDREFLSYIWNFEKNHSPRFIQSIDKFGPEKPVAIFKTHAEIEEVLNTLII